MSHTWWRHQMETFSALLTICSGIHRLPMNSPHKGQWHGTLVFSLICAWINWWFETPSRLLWRNCNVTYAWLEYTSCLPHDDVFKWKHLPRYWPFVRGIHRSPVDSLHKGQCRISLIISLTCDWTYGWAINRNAGDSRHHHTHYVVTVMPVVLTNNLHTGAIWNGPHGFIQTHVLRNVVCLKPI